MSAPRPRSSRPIVAATGGGIFWVGDGAIPEVRRVAAGPRRSRARNWMGLRANGDYVVTGFSETAAAAGHRRAAAGVGA